MRIKYFYYETTKRVLRAVLSMKSCADVMIDNVDLERFHFRDGYLRPYRVGLIETKITVAVLNYPQTCGCLLKFQAIFSDDSASDQVTSSHKVFWFRV